MNNMLNMLCLFMYCMWCTPFQYVRNKITSKNIISFALNPVAQIINDLRCRVQFNHLQFPDSVRVAFGYSLSESLWSPEAYRPHQETSCIHRWLNERSAESNCSHEVSTEINNMTLVVGKTHIAKYLSLPVSLLSYRHNESTCHIRFLLLRARELEFWWRAIICQVYWRLRDFLVEISSEADAFIHFCQKERRSVCLNGMAGHRRVEAIMTT